MKTDVWMPFYIGDYLRDTMHLSTVQHGAYLLLILHYWTQGGPLPDDDAYLSGVAKLPWQNDGKTMANPMANAWQTHRQTLGKFFIIAGGLWRHKRIDAELAKALKMRQTRSDAGKRGADGKWHGKTMAKPMAKPLAKRWPSHVQSPSHTHTGSVCVAGAVEAPPGFPKTEAKARTLRHGPQAPKSECPDAPGPPLGSPDHNALLEQLRGKRPANTSEGEGEGEGEAKAEKGQP